MKYSISKNINANTEVLKVDIRLDDECRNGHEDFAITGETRTIRGRELSGGCIHETIIEHFPEFQIFVDLHLNQFDGTPMYAVENGYYHMQQNNIDAMAEMLMLKIDEIPVLMQAEDQNHFKYLINKLALPERWALKASEAIKQLEALTGEKFESQATRARNAIMTPEEMAAIEQLIESGYYTPEAIAARKAEKARIKAEAATAAIWHKFDMDTEHLAINRDLALAFVKLGLPDNAIFYNHTMTIKFNWCDHRKKLVPEQIDQVKSYLADNGLFEGDSI
jgi:hypothetical protein